MCISTNKKITLSIEKEIKTKKLIKIFATFLQNMPNLEKSFNFIIKQKYIP